MFKEQHAEIFDMQRRRASVMHWPSVEHFRLHRMHEMQTIVMDDRGVCP